MQVPACQLLAKRIALRKLGMGWRISDTTKLIQALHLKNLELLTSQVDFIFSKHKHNLFSVEVKIYIYIESINNKIPEKSKKLGVTDSRSSS